MRLGCTFKIATHNWRSGHTEPLAFEIQLKAKTSIETVMKHKIVSGNRDEALSIAEVKIKQAIKNWKGYSAKASAT